MDRLIGKKLDGRYVLNEIVGVGGMAVVYKATDVLTNMTVAIKILKDEYLSNEEFCQRFRNESKAIALLNHKNIVKVYDVSNSEYLQYIVMEYIDGITLKDYIEQQGRLSCKEAVHFTTQILKALQHAHDRGIVHRDVKPQNIMLLSNGEIKVTDFGIARVKGSETKSTSGSSSTIGSVHYISPEQASGQQTDARADVYSVGVMLYEMLTGELPFDADNTVSVAVMHLQADPRMPREINPNIPEALEEITMQAMQKDVGHRYQSANQMLMDLDAFKRDANVHFEYRYVSDDTPTKYINAVYNQRRMEEEEIEHEKSPVIPVLSGIAVAFFLVAIVMAWLVLDESRLFDKNTSQSGMVPNFIGSNYEEVIANPDYEYAFIIEWDFSNEFAENSIMNQSPKAGRNVFNNSKVRLTVSKGVERLLVPEFNDMTYDQYSEECIKLNVKPTKFDVYSDTIAEGYVINTNPQPRSDIQEGATVEVYVSQGPKPKVLLMPNCQNMLYNEAKAKLDAMGIKSITVIEVDSEKPQGTILSQEPALGTEIDETTPVKFTISNGTAPTGNVKIEFDVPEGLSSQSLRVEITIDGETVYTENVNTSEKTKISAAITGAGSGKEAKVYLAGVLYETVNINFTTQEIKKTTVNPDFKIPTPEG